MYEDVTKELRNLLRAYKVTDNGNCHQAKIIAKAAVAIEELSMKLHGDEAAIAGMKREIERMVVAGKPRWIPVAEKLPEDYELVLTCDDRQNIHMMSQTKKYKYPFGISPVPPRYFMVKYWMPLPEPPKDGE